MENTEIIIYVIIIAISICVLIQIFTTDKCALKTTQKININEEFRGGEGGHGGRYGGYGGRYGGYSRRYGGWGYGGYPWGYYSYNGLFPYYYPYWQSYYPFASQPIETDQAPDN